MSLLLPLPPEASPVTNEPIANSPVPIALSQATAGLAADWDLPAGMTLLNHGSFGLSPRIVLDAQARWMHALAARPMEFYLRHWDQAIAETLEAVGEFVGVRGRDLALVDNATVAMNIVAASVPLEPGDEVLLTDHEYGAVQRIWQQATRRQQAIVRTVTLPCPLDESAAIIERVAAAITPRTRLLVVSHLSSPTAVVLPVQALAQLARERGVLCCVDGPHALAMRDLKLSAIGCDYYCASGHKWLCAALGSGWLYVAPRLQAGVRSPITSWGRSLSGRPASWQDELHWWGTRNVAAGLSLPVAIEWLKGRGLAEFRETTHALAQRARLRISELTGLAPLTPDAPEWYGSMITVPLPPRDLPPRRPNQADPWQSRLRDEFGIEVPIVEWKQHRHVRVSCHLYTSTTDIDRLVEALRVMLAEG